MFYSPDSSIDEFLVHDTHVLNYLELQSEAQLLLARYGMDGMRLQEGRMLLNQVQTTQWLMRDQRRQQKASTIQGNRVKPILLDFPPTCPLFSEEFLGKRSTLLK